MWGIGTLKIRMARIGGAWETEDVVSHLAVPLRV